MKPNLPDTQNKPDSRNITINKAGIKDINCPIIFIDKDNTPQHTIGNWNMTVELPKDIKGTHMSRFVEILNEGTPTFSVDTFADILNKISTKLTADNVQAQVMFTFFHNKIAPVSKISSLMDYQVLINGSIHNGKTEVFLKVVIPVTSLCPCSKNISKYGAHNQRSHISINALITNNKLAVEDLISIAESSASSELYAVLKREDEKEVTERAYDNPAFVEDLVRDIAKKLNKYKTILYYKLESENFESIHNHSAYALIENDKR